MVKVLDLRSRGLEFDSCSHSVYPVVMGTRWNEELVCGNVFSCRKCAAQGGETVKKLVPIPEGT